MSSAKKFKDFSQIDTMLMQLKDILRKEPKYACSFKDGLKVLKILGI